LLNLILLFSFFAFRKLICYNLDVFEKSIEKEEALQNIDLSINRTKELPKVRKLDLKEVKMTLNNPVEIQIAT